MIPVKSTGFRDSAFRMPSTVAARSRACRRLSSSAAAWTTTPSRANPTFPTRPEVSRISHVSDIDAPTIRRFQEDRIDPQITQITQIKNKKIKNESVFNLPWF
jgi:hypothetical protein